MIPKVQHMAFISTTAFAPPIALQLTLLVIPTTTLVEGGVDFWKHDNCFHKWSTIDTYVRRVLLTVEQ